MALKIDINKAFDRVDWNYLLAVMIKMWFHQKWVDWMKLCLGSAQFSVMVNEDSLGPISPRRGLRQGDQLSPYLFIICTEGLSSLLKKSERSGELHGIKVCKGVPVLSHLLLVDDCFCFAG